MTNNQEVPPKGKERDILLPLLGAGAASTVLFICICVAGIWFLRTLPSDLPDSISPYQDPENPFVVQEPAPQTIQNPCPYSRGFWRPQLEDEFASDRNQWPLIHEQTQNLDIKPGIEDGSLQLRVTAYRDSFFVFKPSKEQELGDFQLMAVFKPPEGAQPENFGLVFRMSEQGYYYFGISSSEYLYIRRYTAIDGQWKGLYSTHFKRIREDGSNELMLVSRGQEYTFCVNGEKVTKLQDDSFSGGYVGIAANLPMSEQEAVLLVDRFHVYAP